MDRIQKQCVVCGQAFVPKTIDSVYCSKICGNAAYREKKRQKRKEEEKKAVIAKISDDRLYISVPEAVALFNIAKSTLYRLIRQKRIPAINLGTRLVRIERAAIEEMFPIRKTPLVKEKQVPKVYRLDRKIVIRLVRFPKSLAYPTVQFTNISVSIRFQLGR